MVSGLWEPVWDAWFSGPAKRCEGVHSGSQRRVHSLGREVAAKEGCEALLKGALHGEVDLLTDKNTFVFKERIQTDCIDFVWEKGTAPTAGVQRSLVENHF